MCICMGKFNLCSKNCNENEIEELKIKLENEINICEEKAQKEINA